MVDITELLWLLKMLATKDKRSLTLLTRAISSDGILIDREQYQHRVKSKFGVKK